MPPLPSLSPAGPSTAPASRHPGRIRGAPELAAGGSAGERRARAPALARLRQPFRCRPLLPGGGRPPLARPVQAAALGAILLLAPPAAAQSPAPHVYEGYVTHPTPRGEELYYFKYLQDSLLVLGMGLAGEPRVHLPNATFTSILHTLHRAGALRDVPELRYALDAQLRPASSDHVAIAARAPMVPLLSTLALLLAAAVVAVQHRRIRQAGAERERELTLRRRLTEAREAERAHFARELHDGPIQDLCALQLALAARSGHTLGSMAPPVPVGAREAVTDVLAELRGLCDHLRPPSLDAFGLSTALEAHVQRFACEHPTLDIRLHIEPAPDSPPLSPDHQLALFRVAQEALNNAARHACASRIEVSLVPGARTRLAVEDDGVGPPTRDAMAYAREGHYGLLGMQERADLLGAKLRIERSPLGGTRVVASLADVAA